MKQLVLSEEKLKELDSFIQEMPTKFGFQLLQFFQKIAQEQNPPMENIEKQENENLD